MHNVKMYCLSLHNSTLPLIKRMGYLHVGLGSDNDEWNNTNIPSTSAPSPAIFGFWDDLNPVNDSCNEYCSGEVFYHVNEERFVVWFNDIAHWVTGEDSF